MRYYKSMCKPNTMHMVTHFQGAHESNKEPISLRGPYRFVYHNSDLKHPQTKLKWRNGLLVLRYGFQPNHLDLHWIFTLTNNYSMVQLLFFSKRIWWLSLDCRVHKAVSKAFYRATMHFIQEICRLVCTFNFLNSWSFVKSLLFWNKILTH